MSLAGIMGLLGLVLSFAALWAAFKKRWGSTDGLAAALTAVACLAWISTLGLSAGALVHLPMVAGFWILSSAVLLYFQRGGRELFSIPGQSLWNRALFLFPALTLVVALLGAPNTNDGVSYHLPRAMAWIQQGALKPYACFDPRQIYFAPLAELLQMHMLLLAGGDRLVALPQWVSYLAVGAMAFGVARRLGGDKAGWLALAACWSAPMAIAQASSTQNDLICAMFCLASVILFWRAAREGSLSASALGGIAAALACLSKATAYIFLAPWLLVLAFMALKMRHGLGLRLFAALACFTLLQLPYWTTNLGLQSGPLGPSLGTDMQEHGPLAIAMSSLRQAALHIPDLGELRPRVAALIDRSMRKIGQDPVSPLSSYDAHGSFTLAEGWPSDSTSGNAAQLLVWMALLFFIWKLKAESRFSLLTATAGAVLFCALVKWQPGASRLHLPGFVFASIGIGLGLSSSPRWAQQAAVTLMLAASLPCLLWLEERPMLSKRNIFNTPRWEQYFREGSYLQMGVEAILHKAQERNCSKVALTTGGYYPEYLLWEGLRMQGKPFELRSVRVNNVSGRYEKHDYLPCLSLGDGWKVE